ncbi:MAG TPA: hypothetical protein VMT89_05525 [Candidatus Acidoferrales bacterium]|nr:hypothetical protein [Candidatus Acidoferrales bacterium]
MSRRLLRQWGYAIVLGLALSASFASSRACADDDVVPKTVEGGSAKVKHGGHEIGEGFSGIGHGIKDVFTGEESKGDFKKAAKIGEGFKDVGVGTAGVGRGVGRGIRKGVKGDNGESSDEVEKKQAPPDSGKVSDQPLHEENIE